MLNGVRKLWRSWRERRRLRDSLPRGDEGSSPPADAPASTAAPVSGPAAEASAPDIGLARRIKSHTHIGILRKVDHVSPIQISRSRPPIYHVMPAEMQNAPASPLPLVKRHLEASLERAPAGEELVEGEPAFSPDAGSLSDATTVDAAWDALWALRGTPTAARPVASAPVPPPEQAEPLSRASAQVTARPAPAPRSAAPRSAAPRPPVQGTSQGVLRPTPTTPAVPAEASESLPPASPTATVGRMATPIPSQPPDTEHIQTSMLGQSTASLPVEHSEPGAQPVPVSDESTTLAGQQAVQPTAPPPGRPAVARRKADLPARPVARRKPGRYAASLVHPPALPISSGQGRSQLPVQTRRPLIDQPQVSEQQETEHSPPPAAKSGPPLAASLRAGLQRLGVLRRPAQERPAREQIPGSAASERPAAEEKPTPDARPSAIPRPVEAVRPAPPPASPRPAVQSTIARQADFASPPTVRPMPEQFQPLSTPTWAARPVATSAPSKESTPTASPAPLAATRPVARRLMDSVPTSMTIAGATPRISRTVQVQPRPTFEPARPAVEPDGQESRDEEPWPAEDATVLESPVIETAPTEQAVRERTIERPLEESIGRTEAQKSPLALQPQVEKWPDFVPSETPSAEPFAAQPEQGIPRPIPSAVSPIAPATSRMVTVQRTIRDAQDLVRVSQPALVPATIQTAAEILVQPAEAAPPAAATTDEQGGAQAQDIESISRQVYQIIRRRLAIERERDIGR